MPARETFSVYDVTTEAEAGSAPLAELFNPNHDARGRFAARPGHRTIGGAEHTTITEPATSGLSGPVATRDWAAANLQIDMEPAHREAFLDTLAAAKLPQAHLQGSRYTTAPSAACQIGPDGFYYDQAAKRYRAENRILGEYEAAWGGVVHIPPAALGLQAVVIHEVGHHVALRVKPELDADGWREARAVNDVLKRKIYEPFRVAEDRDVREIAAPLGLRRYSFANVDEFRADCYLVAAKGSPAQQSALQNWLGLTWDKLFGGAETTQGG